MFTSHSIAHVRYTMYKQALETDRQLDGEISLQCLSLHIMDIIIVDIIIVDIIILAIHMMMMMVNPGGDKPDCLSRFNSSTGNRRGRTRLARRHFFSFAIQVFIIIFNRSLGGWFHRQHDVKQLTPFLGCPFSSACVHLLICPNMKTSFCLCMPLYLFPPGSFSIYICICLGKIKSRGSEVRVYLSDYQTFQHWYSLTIRLSSTALGYWLRSQLGDRRRRRRRTW